MMGKASARNRKDILNAFLLFVLFDVASRRKNVYNIMGQDAGVCGRVTLPCTALLNVERCW